MLTEGVAVDNSNCRVKWGYEPPMLTRRHFLKVINLVRHSYKDPDSTLEKLYQQQFPELVRKGP